MFRHTNQRNNDSPLFCAEASPPLVPLCSLVERVRRFLFSNASLIFSATFGLSPVQQYSSWSVCTTTLLQVRHRMKHESMRTCCAIFASLPTAACWLAEFRLFFLPSRSRPIVVGRKGGEKEEGESGWLLRTTRSSFRVSVGSQFSYMFLGSEFLQGTKFGRKKPHNRNPLNYLQ